MDWNSDWIEKGNTLHCYAYKSFLVNKLITTINELKQINTDVVQGTPFIVIKLNTYSN